MSFLLSPTFHAAFLCTLLLNAAVAFLAYRAGWRRGFLECCAFHRENRDLVNTLNTFADKLKEKHDHE